MKWLKESQGCKNRIKSGKYEIWKEDKGRKKIEKWKMNCG